ncbi:CRAL-TRIO domain-containing protein [Umbelopsis sp. AD052]|nr:CRAL-TRIO domain-containing protein [Umbelopsis sp. AD052]
MLTSIGPGQEQAVKQLTDTVKWRAENDVDLYPVATKNNKLPVLYAVRGFDIEDANLTAAPGLSESVLRIASYMGGSCLHKTDKEGCPVYIERLGYHAAKEIAKFTTVDEVLQYHIGCNEFLHRIIDKDCSKKAGKFINRETVIFDCTGMGWHQFHTPALQYLRAISENDQKYYPETMNKLFIVNAPSAFVIVWKMVKGWLDPGTIAKIQILGKDFQEPLLNHISAENLPKFLGGECECSHMPGGCVPSAILGNIPPYVAGEQNPTVVTSYSTEIMEEAKTNPELRGDDAV